MLIVPRAALVRRWLIGIRQLNGKFQYKVALHQTLLNGRNGVEIARLVMAYITLR